MTFPMAKKYTNPQEALHLMYRFCSYRERAHNEVRTKLINMGVYGDKLEEIIAQLVSEGYLNEERYARAYVSGKFRIKQWGRRKILMGLKKQQIGEYAIRKGMTEIDDEEYEEVISKLIQKKMESSRITNQFEKNKKVALFLAQKGFEPELIWAKIKENEAYKP
jgi:regulatory protein